jgi:phosphoglycolate phosphatase
MKIPLFDLDGTLFKIQKTAHTKAPDFAFRQVYKVKTDFHNGQHGLGRTDKQVILEISNLHGLRSKMTEEKIEEIKKIMVDYFLKNTKDGDFIALPGADNLLRELKKLNIPVGILTGNIEEIGWRKLELANIKNYFDFGAFGGVTDKRVELVRIAKKAADEKFKTDFTLKNFVIIGDTPNDVICAKQAGISVIAVASGRYSFEELASYFPDLLVCSLTEQDRIINFLAK